ncbi:hypothetical protein TNCV_292771 [Trichonephila clavipes]|nr:hypothetical protein TNCV_292771 [Trichonephila clavipes]
MFFGQPTFSLYVNNTEQKPIESNGQEYLNPLQDRVGAPCGDPSRILLARSAPMPFTSITPDGFYDDY